jgi:exodeoxyribonuclease V alpha subunit
METLKATIQTIRGIYGNDAVINACTENGKRIRIVGDKILSFSVGEYRSFEGEWQDYKNFGKQFRVANSSLSDISNSMLKSFLMNQTGIGQATANTLIDCFGSDLPELLEQSKIGVLIKAPSIGKAVAFLAVKAWHDQGAKKELLDYLIEPLSNNPKAINTITGMVLRAHHFYKETTLEKLKDDPYRLWAFGSWKDTDLLAQALGVGMEDRRRLLCAMEEALYLLYCDGHTAPTPDLVDVELDKLLDGTNPCLSIYEACRSDGLNTSRIRVRDNGAWSLPSAYIMEEFVSQWFSSSIKKNHRTQLPLFKDTSLHHYLLPGGFLMDADQKLAVQSILDCDVTAIIGSAGTGKTSVLFAANDLLNRSGKEVLQIALTGKAAQRLAKQTQHDAYTIASLLGMIKVQPKFLDKYDMPVLFIDEASMVDLPMMYHVLKAFEGKHFKVVFIGDRGQLPPIGTGLIFHKMIESKHLPIIELKTNYRAISGSSIPETSDLIRNGSKFVESKDVSFLETESSDIMSVAIDSYMNNISNGSVQIISATKRTMASANRKLQAILLANAPEVEATPEFKVGDKVIYKKNDRHLGLVNGSMGVIVQIEGDTVTIDEEKGEIIPADIVVAFEDEGRIPLLVSQVKNFGTGEWYLQQAYAVTGHQAQGSEFDVVIVTIEDTRILDRSWLYTAVTRAKDKVILVGSKALAQQAIDDGNIADNRMVGINFNGN